MSILFLGLLFDKSREHELLAISKHGLQAAVNTYQWNFIDGFLANDCRFCIINSLPVGTWPVRFKKIILRKKNWQYKNVPCTEIGSINLPVIKQIMRERAYRKEIIKWAKESPANRVIVTYSLYLPFLKALSKIKKLFPDMKICAIIADLPSKYGILPRNRIKAAIYDFYGKIMLNKTKVIDSFVLLTRQMRYPLEVGDRPYVVVEGIAADNYDHDYINTYGGDKKIVLYTGSLKCKFGIIDLLDAFSLIDDAGFELWIAGAGEGEGEIKKRAAVDSRIKYFGFVTKNEVYRLQSQATVLINPRKNEGEYTKYSFPSKTIEYMASGVPVLMYKLDGIPDEYDEYLTYFKDDSIDSMAESIKSICNKSLNELQEMGEKAKRFILENKNPCKSAEKILNLIGDMTSESIDGY